MKVKTQLGDELKHVYAEKYSQHIIESEFEHICNCVHICPAMYSSTVLKPHCCQLHFGVCMTNRQHSVCVKMSCVYMHA